MTCGLHVLQYVDRRASKPREMTRHGWCARLAMQSDHAKCQSSRTGSHISQRYAVRVDGDVMCNLKSNAETDTVVPSRESPRPLRHPGLFSVRGFSIGTRCSIGSFPSWPRRAHPHVFHIKSCLPPVCRTCLHEGELYYHMNPMTVRFTQ